MGLAVLGAPGLVRAAEEQVAVADAQWVRTWCESTCGDVVGPVGPTDALAPVYGPDSLHVGAAAGREESRSYVRLDLSELIARPVGGTLVYVLGSAEAGTVNASSAEVRACLTVDEVGGDLPEFSQQVPAIDCAVSTTATVDADTSTLAIDLGPFLAAWHERNHGLALVPVADPQSSAAAGWHLTILHAYDPIHARVEVASAPDSHDDPAAPAGADALLPPFAGVLPAPGAPRSGAPGGVPSTAESASAPPPILAERRASVGGLVPFDYPAVFLLPIAVAVAAWEVQRALTRTTGGLR